MPDRPAGTIRYWAAARAAAGVAEERYAAATLAEALRAAGEAHGDALVRVLARCSYLVDGAPVGRRSHDAVRLGEGAVVEVLPPFAGGAGAAAGDTTGAAAGHTAGHTTGATAGRTTGRTGATGRAGGFAGPLLALVLLIASVGGAGVLAPAVLLVQLGVAPAWFTSAGVPGRRGGVVVAAVAAAAADGLVLARSGRSLAPLAAVLGLSLVAAIAHQLLRRDRDCLTISMATTVAATGVAVAAAAYVDLRSGPSGAAAAAAALLATAAALLAASLARPPTPPRAGQRAGRPAGLTPVAVGLAAAGVVVGTAAAAVVGAVGGGLSATGGALIGLAAATVAAVVGFPLAGAVAAAPGGPGRRAAGVLAALVPLALAAPAAYAVARGVAG